MTRLFITGSALFTLAFFGCGSDAGGGDGTGGGGADSGVSDPTGDDDGDGVENAVDNCVDIFNPTRRTSTATESATPAIPILPQLHVEMSLSAPTVSSQTSSCF